MRDLISRQAAIEDIREYKVGPNRCCDESEIKGYNDGLDTAISALATLPSADVVQVVHAYWRDTGSGQECSACKEIQYGYDTSRNYCPNCGAKMGISKEVVLYGKKIL